MSHCPVEALQSECEFLKRHWLLQHSPLWHSAPATSLQVLASQQGSLHSWKTNRLTAKLQNRERRTQVVELCKLLTDLRRSTVTRLPFFQDAVPTDRISQDVGRHVVETPAQVVVGPRQHIVDGGHTAGAPPLRREGRIDGCCHHTEPPICTGTASYEEKNRSHTFQTE